MYTVILFVVTVLVVAILLPFLVRVVGKRDEPVNNTEAIILRIPLRLPKHPFYSS